MADKGWTARVATAAGVAAGTGAAQLGLGYGLGVIVWPVTVAQDRSEWLGSLGWATWITASATVFGAVIASRLGGAQATRSRWPWRLAFAISAGVGALVAVALIALPARSAVRLDAHSPQAIAAGYALLGVVLGVLVAYWAVVSRPVAANLIATAAWLWALAVTAIVVELSVNRDSATYLTSWQFVAADNGVRYGVIYWPSALLTLVAAFVIGIIAVIPAVRRGDLGLGATISGAVGPLLVAISFLALSPRLTDTPGPIESAYLIAPYAVLAGLAGSALTVAVGQSLAARRATALPSASSSDADTPIYGSKSDGAGAGAAAGIPDGRENERADEREEGYADERETEPAIGHAKLPGQPGPPAEPTASGRARRPASAPPARRSPSATPATPSPSPGPTIPSPSTGPSTSSPSGPGTSSPSSGPGTAGSASGPGTAGSASSPGTPSPSTGPSTRGSTSNPGTPSPSTGPSTRGSTSGPGTPSSSSTPGTPRLSSTPGAPSSSSTTGTPSPSTGPGAPSLRPIPDPPKAPRPLTDPPKAPAPVTGPPATPRPAGANSPDDDRTPPESVGDAEIAAAARTSRFRRKKTAPARETPDPKPTKSTVTPPPATPTIAQINPKPPANDH